MSSFFQRIDWDAVERGLAARGKPPSATAFARLKEMTREEMGKREGDAWINEGMFEKGGTLFVNFLQALFKFFSGDSTAFSNLSPLESSSSSTEYAMLNKASQSLYMRMRNEGGELGQLAELVTGQTIAGSGRLTDNMHESVFNQVKRGIDGLTPAQVAQGASLNFDTQGQRYPVVPVSEPASPITPRTTATESLTGQGLAG